MVTSQGLGGELATNVGAHCGAWSWAIFAGSHLPEADEGKLQLLRAAGVTSIKYLLYEGAPETQYEDLRRLRQELGFSEVVLRLMHGDTLLSPTQVLDLYAERIRHARSVGLCVVLQPLNEPNLELRDTWTPTAVADWFNTFAVQARYRWADIEIVSPPVAPYAPNSWEWWQGLQPADQVADSCGVHVYANTPAQLTGDWSLPWWLGQTTKPLRILECGCQTGTPAATRTAMLPQLYTRLAAEPRVRGFYPFILSSEGSEHAEHWYSDSVVTLLRQVAQGQTPATPEPPSVPDVPPADLEGVWTLEVGGVRIPFTLHRGLVL